MRRIDPTVPVHRQPTFVVRPGDHTRDRGIVDNTHSWFNYQNGVQCGWCDRLLVRTSGRYFYRGQHRARKHGLTVADIKASLKPWEVAADGFFFWQGRITIPHDPGLSVMMIERPEALTSVPAVHR